MTMPLASVLNVMSDEQLEKLLKKAVQEGIELGQKKPIEKPLTKEEAARFLRIEPRTLDLRFQTHRLPVSLKHVAGGSIYFFASELEAFIKKS
jgi:hypothetical protein